MSEIKRGDLVMVVKPSECCGQTGTIGAIYVAGDSYVQKVVCRKCGFKDNDSMRTDIGNDSAYLTSRLRKIDPPATGEYDGVAVRKPIKHKDPA